MASVKVNTVTSYIAQGYAAIIGILVMPFLFDVLGGEGFALVGFFTVLQLIINLLGAGFNPAIAREVSREENKFRNQYLISLIKSFEIIFLLICSCIIVFALLGGTWFSNNWFGDSTVEFNLANVVSIIFVVCAIRFQSVLYLSSLRGFEDFTWLNIVNIIVNTFRFPLSLLLVWLYPSVEAYFFFQFVIALCELAITRWRVSELLGVTFWLPNHFDKKNVQRVSTFAKSVAVAAIVSVVIGQADKIILSKALTLPEFGIFSVIMMLSNGILLLGLPIGTVLMPRLTALYSKNNIKEFSDLYIKSTCFVTILVVPIAVVIASNSKNLLFVFTGDSDAAAWGTDILSFYVLGNILLVVGGFQYYLQVAKGELKYHVRYSFALMFFSLPLLYFMINHFGAIGAALVWFGFRLFSFLFWVPYIHKKMGVVEFREWLHFSIIPAIVVALLTYALAQAVISDTESNRFKIILDSTMIYLFAVFVGIIVFKFLDHIKKSECRGERDL